MGTWQSVMKRIESKREKAGRNGGFDFTFIDKKFIKNIETGRPYCCKFCAKPMYHAGNLRKSGDMLLSCESDECIGNVDTPEHIVKKKLREMGLDTKLNFNGRKALLNKMTSQQWMTKYNPV